MQQKFDVKMLKIAFESAQESKAEKRQVGAIVVDMATLLPISYGHNKMYHELREKNCENEFGETYECVLHGEEVAIFNMIKLPNYSKEISKHQKTLYCTYSPCMNCCKLIVNAGIKRLVYCDEHKSNFVTSEIINGYSPKDFLEEMGVSITRINKATVFGNTHKFRK